MVCMNTDRTQDQLWTAFIYDCDKRRCKILKTRRNFALVRLKYIVRRVSTWQKQTGARSERMQNISVTKILNFCFFSCENIEHIMTKKKLKKRLNNLVLNSMISSLKVCCLQCSWSPTCRSLNEKLKKRKYHYFTTFFPPFVWTALLLFHINLHTHRLCLATKQKPKLKYSFLWAETDVHLMFEI